MNLEIVHELPASAPAPKPFAPSGFLPPSNGLVVRVSGIGGESWYGRFLRGSNELDAVFRHPNGVEAIVVAGGFAYRIDPLSPDGARLFRGRVARAFESVAQRLVVLMSSDFQFEAIGPTGTKWKTGSLFCEDAADIAIDSSRITGRWLSPLNRAWGTFAIDLETGRTHGGEFIWICGATRKAAGGLIAG